MIHLRHRRVARALAIAVIVAAAPFSNVMAAGPLTVGPNVDISRFADNESETTLAINPTNTSNIVVVSNFAVADALMEAVTFDGGATWTSRMIADGTDGLGVACCDPNASFDQYGNYFLVYLDSRAKKVQVAYSTDGGTTMQYLGAVDHTDNSSPTTNGKKWSAGADQPSLATGPGGTWFVYKLFGQGGQLLQVRGLPVTGLGQFGSLSPSKGVPGSKYGSFGDIVVGDTGQVVVTYQDGTGGQGPVTIWTNLDPDGFGAAGFGAARAATASNVGGFDYIARWSSQRELRAADHRHETRPSEIRRTSAASTTSRRSPIVPSTPRRVSPTTGRAAPTTGACTSCTRTNFPTRATTRTSSSGTRTTTGPHGRIPSGSMTTPGRTASSTRISQSISRRARSRSASTTPGTILGSAGLAIRMESPTTMPSTSSLSARTRVHPSGRMSG